MARKGKSKRKGWRFYKPKGEAGGAGGEAGGAGGEAGGAGGGEGGIEKDDTVAFGSSRPISGGSSRGSGSGSAGNRDGSSDRDSYGSSDGDSYGSRDRDSYGSSDGDSYGSRDRDRDGSRDRDSDGSRDGDSDGSEFMRWSPLMDYDEPGLTVRPEFGGMPLQKLRMTDENQEQLKELLQNLQNYDSGSDFWKGEDVERADRVIHHHEMYDSDDEEPTPEPVTTLFVQGKLSRYGFDREHSKKALESGGGDFGATLEHLLHQVFTERYGQEAVSPDGLEEVPMDECLSQRNEEAQALTAIFGERFKERIFNTVWAVTLDLSGNAAKNGRQFESRGGGGAVLAQKVCQSFIEGKGCRFGNKCKFEHQLPTEGRSRAGCPDQNSQSGFSSCSPPVYELEVRFPRGNRYPFQAPLVAFSTTDESVGAAGRLSVTERLFSEALAAAKTNEPVVSRLITFCKQESTMKELLAVSHHKYSTPPPVVLLPSPSLATAKSKSMRSNTSHSKSRTNTSKLDEREEDDKDEAVPVQSGSVSLRKKRVNKHQINLKTNNILNENGKLCQEFKKKQSCDQYRSMLEQRRKLPAWQEKENILDTLNQCQVLVVSGMTGCGKTTQIPQFILDASLDGPAEQVANIICTQPRRISATSVAERVAHERAERLGNSVGYQIRLESVQSSATRLLYCTIGVLLRRLEGEADLKGVTHLIVDEVHERTEESDFLLMVLKDLIKQRPDLKIILMSATLNANLFSEYFYNCPTVHIPGRTFPVDQFFLEDAIKKAKYVINEDSFYIRYGDWSCYRVGQDVNDDDEDSIPDQRLSLSETVRRYRHVDKSVVRTISKMDLDKINMDLVESLLEWIVAGEHSYPPGAVLVFLPGLADIKSLYYKLKFNTFLNDKSKPRCVVYPLHSTLSNEEQQAVFSHPPEGVTKIILSTNIAETSVTIDDVVYVIDCGKMKEKRYEAISNTESLVDTWVSRANALQRKGRAGRVASGVCFHLFTSHCFKHHLSERQLPEIQRVPLEQLCLRTKILDMFAEQTLESVFSRLIESPAMRNVAAAKENLRNLGALTADEKLTPLGHHLASLPVEPHLGKLMLYGAIFRCLDPALTIAASLTVKSPFMTAWEKQRAAEEKKLSFAVTKSDHVAVLQAYNGWCNAAKKGHQAGSRYCKDNFLCMEVFEKIASLKRQFAELLSDSGFITKGLKSSTMERMRSKGTDGVLDATGSEANLNSGNIRLLSAMLCAALYPNVAQLKYHWKNKQIINRHNAKLAPRPWSEYVTQKEGSVKMHPSSVNNSFDHYHSPFLVYLEKMCTTGIYFRDCSVVSVYPLVLFGGRQVITRKHKKEFIISLDDGWISFSADSYQVVKLVNELRCKLDQLLEDKMRNPSMDLCSCPRSSSIIQMIVHLITTQ